MLVFLFSVGIMYSDDRIMPMIESDIISYTENFATEIINQSVCETLKNGSYDYKDMVDVTYSETGSVESITGNYVNINKLKAEISLIGQQKMADQRILEMSVPIGAFTGNEIFKNMGPPIHLSTEIMGSITTKIKSAFSGAGVNQTLHTIEIEITANISTNTLGLNCDTTIVTNALVAQTVIVGKVPELCLNSAFN